MTEVIGIGTVLNSRYTVQQELGQGGMGAVYLAQDLQHRRPVAIKVARLGGLEARDRFRREAAFLKRLHHHSLPRVWDYFSDTQRDFLVMEYIPGEDLESLVHRHGPQPEWLVLRWADELLDGLDYLHTPESPLIHRDIKPGNLKLRTDETLVLVDFGIATELRPDKDTEQGAQAVTPGFSPPEQYTDKPTDARTDIYSVGATLYFLLTGQTPRAAIERAEKSAALPAPSEVVPSISSSSDMLIGKALQLHHEDRWRSAAEMRHAVAYASQNLTAKSPQLFSTTPSKPQPVEGSRPPGSRRSSRRVGVVMLLIIVAVALSAAGLLALNSPGAVGSNEAQRASSSQDAVTEDLLTPLPTNTPGAAVAATAFAIQPIVVPVDGTATSDGTVFLWQPISAIDEDFQHPSSVWAAGAKDGFKWGAQDGTYRLAMGPPSTLLSIPLDVSVGDFAASLRGRVLAGGGGVRFGMQFRSGDDSYYRLDYLPGAGLELSKQVNGASSLLLERFPVSDNAPENLVRFGIIASGLHLQVMFEDQLVAEIADNALERGDISLYAISGPGGRSEVAFSTFQMEPGSTERVPLAIKPYDDPAGRFTLLTPATWRQSADTLGVNFDDLEHLARVVIIPVDHAQPGDSPQEVARKAVAQAAPSYPDFVPGLGKDVEINGQAAYEQSLRGQVLGVDVIARLIVLGDNAPGYAAVAVVPASDDAVMRPLMDYVLTSFRAVDRATATPEVGQAAATGEQAATSTTVATSTPVPTRSSPTRQPTNAPTATRVPTATARPATATPRPPAATATPSAAGAVGSYAAATLRSPANGSAFNGPDATIVFQWDSAGSLGADDYYVLTILFPHEGQTWQDVQWIKGSSLAVPNYIYGASTLPGTLRWNVVVMRQTGTKPDGQKDGAEISPRSITSSFEWTPGGGGGGGGTSPAPDPTRPAPPTRVPTTRRR